MSNRPQISCHKVMCCIAAILIVHSTGNLPAAPPADLRDLNSHCPMQVPESIEQWEARREQLRLQLSVSLGQWPAIELDPVRPAIYGRIAKDGYSIEKVTFESLPGLFVTGNLYRPSKLAADRKVPAVLCPHGHWSEARFYDADPSAVKQMLATGAERYENAARNHIQARCVQLARMGCVVFHWDMVGYCDNRQISFERAHRFAAQESATELADDGWPLFSPLAEANLQSVMGLQSLATQRAVDMLLQLPEVDHERIAITGASGGGTQSFIGAALDDRIRIAFPAVMVSTGMQGGCTCENCCGLRTGTGNVELAALIAPRPLALTAADDWTRTMPQDGFPELKSLYKLLGKEHNVALFPALHFGHNYNHVSRTNMYTWLNDQFDLGHPNPVLERDFDLAGADELRVWNADHPEPEGGIAFERQLMKLWAQIVDQQMQAMLRGDKSQRQTLQQTLAGGWKAVLGLTTLSSGPSPTLSQSDSGLDFHDALLGNWRLVDNLVLGEADSNPEFGKHTEKNTNHHALQEVWNPAKSDLVLTTGNHTRYYPLLDGSILAAREDDTNQQVVLKTASQALVSNPRLAAAYTYGYNLPLISRQALQLGASLRALTERNESVLVSGSGPDAALAAAGLFCAQEMGADLRRIKLSIEPAGFRFAQAQSIRSPEFLPGSARYWDWPGLLACIRNGNITLHLRSDAAAADQLRELRRLISTADTTITIEPTAAQRGKESPSENGQSTESQ